MAQILHVGAILQKYTKLVDPVIKKLLAEGVSKQTRQLLHYQVNTGGKRIRPTLAILSCLACGGKIQDVIYPAAGLEILHTYTLIIDDMIDNSPMRRGKPTTWKQFGRSVAECVGVDYGATLIATANQSPQPKRIGPILSQTLKKIVDGELMDVLLEQNKKPGQVYQNQANITSITTQTYYKLIEQKTASLFQASCVIGGMCANASQKHLYALEAYGRHFGFAFQMADDILDIYGSNTGKPQGQDIREHKLGNLLVALAFQELSLREKRGLKRILRKPILTATNIKTAIALISKSQAKDKATALARSHIQKAKNSLVHVPKNNWSILLREVADFIVV